MICLFSHTSPKVQVILRKLQTLQEVQVVQVTGVTYLAGGAEEVTHLTRGPHGKEATHRVGGVSNKFAEVQTTQR